MKKTRLMQGGTLVAMALIVLCQGCVSTIPFMNDSAVLQMRQKVGTQERAKAVVKRVIALPLQKEYDGMTFYNVQVLDGGIHDPGRVWDADLLLRAGERLLTKYYVKYDDKVRIQLMPAAKKSDQEPRYLIKLSTSPINYVFFVCPEKYKTAVLGALLVLYPHAEGD